MNSPIEMVIELPSDRSTDRRDASTGPTPIRILTNKSCDFCRRRKRRCDGDGVNPCSRCKALPGIKCTFSQRKLHRSRRAQNRPAPSWVLNGRLRGLLGGGHSLIRRCQLSASPATGLVGTVENAQLKDFFECMGFMQIANQSVVREAMARIMITSISSSSSASLDEKSSETEIDEENRECGTRFYGTTGLPMDTGACLFWGAIAIGGLVQGRPREAITGYISKAEAALESCSSNEASVVTPEVVRACVQMALLHAMNGDKENFRIYEKRTLKNRQDSAENGSMDQVSRELANLIQLVKGMRIYMMIDDVKRRDLEMFVDMDPGPPPKVGETITQDEMSRFVMYGYNRSGQAFWADILENPAKVEIGANWIKPLAYDFVEAIPGTDGGLGHETSGEEVQPMIGGNMREVIRQIIPVYERMQHAVERPCVRMGIGGLLINTALCLSRAGMDDMKGALELANRSVDILVAYPGLFRFDAAYHNSHLVMMFLLSTGSTILYEKLRAVYNKYRAFGGLAVPPMEEWEEIKSYCEHPYCRTAEAMMRSQEELRARVSIVREDEDTMDLDAVATNAELGKCAHVVTGGLSQLEQDSGLITPDLFVDSDEGMPRAVAKVEVKTSFMSSTSAFFDGMVGAPKSGIDPVYRTGYDELVGDILAPEDWRIAAETLL